ncbi:MAG: hypothetical protein DRG39_03190, partial [Deltaproteobacteria bacterium]
MLLTAFGILFTHVISSIIIFLFFSRLLQIKKQNLLTLFVITMGLGSATISLLLTRLIMIFPHHGDLFYISIILSVFLILFLFGYKNLFLVKFLLKEIVETYKSEPYEEDHILKMVKIAIIFLVISIFYMTLLFPIIENDALQYATVARMIYESKTCSFYPLINPDPKTGFYAVSSHPLGYISLITWSYMINGGITNSWITRVISPIYMLYTIILLWYVLYTSRNKICAIFGVLLLLTTPIYYIETV